ncbi:MAG: DUF3500 domain-containing protein [Xanthobacteraceae bacterium]
MSATARPDRRGVVVAGAALLGSAALPRAAAAATGLAPAADLLAATRAFLAKLEPEQRKAASFAWEAPEWRRWSYFGADGFIKPGLRLEQMSAEQKAAAWDVLATVLSPEGLSKAKNVMLLQDILAASGNGTGQRSAQRFSFSVFGTPAESGAWGFRLEGHHLHHSFAVRDGQIASVTPASFSSLPNRVTAGAHAGLVTLKEEESLARQLVGDLAPKRQEKARVSATPLGNILSYAGRERANAQKIGLAAADLTAAQRDILWRLIDTYTADHLPPALAAAQRARVRSGDREAVHFAWYGPNTPEKAFGYRVIADGFVVELGSVDPQAQHLHTVYNDLGNVLGRAG